MTTKAHKLLTGTDLHEPKGVSSVPAGQVYVSDGAGSGVWTTINTTIQFSTGDAKLTYKTVADTGWLMMDDTSIGSATSPATHADPSYQLLFSIIWAINSSWTTVSGGRGGSAAADWAANKSITLPKVLGRSMAIAGSGSGLTARQFGQFLGEETHLLSAAEIPQINAQNTNTVGISVSAGNIAQGAGNTLATSGGSNLTVVSVGNITASGAIAPGSMLTQSFNTGGGVHNIMQPTSFINVMVKI